MPYLIRQNWRGQWCVRKKFTGRLVGKAETKAAALGIIRTIYVNKKGVTT